MLQQAPLALDSRKSDMQQEQGTFPPCEKDLAARELWC